MYNAASSTILTYYKSIESRLGYRLFLGGTRHFGYYISETSWPWPITTALRTMESKLLTALQCFEGAKVLDAGCGAGQVALYIANNAGFRVEGIDLTPHHVTKATQNVQHAGMSDRITIRVADYHKLDMFKDANFDGIYTMETLVHSPNPQRALKEFMRVLRPGGCLVMHEYDHKSLEDTPKDIAHEAKTLNALVGMPAFEMFETDDLKSLAQDTGFEDVHLTDMSKHIVPMLWLFYVFAYVPYLILKLFGLQYSFVNTASGVGMYKGRKSWRYVQVRARKPL